MPKGEIRVALIGHKFMGRAHTHGYTDVPIFFDPPLTPVKKVLCARSSEARDIARRWGWEHYEADWRKVVERDDVDLVDIGAPSTIHKEVAIAAAKNGKHIFCEKPLALTLEDAREMLEAVQEASVKHMIGFNLRRVPALALAKKMIDDGELGQIFHFRCCFQQSWLVDPGFPLVWRLRKADAGYGSHGDLGAHIVDIARWLVGEFAEVVCLQTTFVKERPLAAIEDGLYAEAGEGRGEVDVDDASLWLIRFAKGAAVGTLEVTRYGTGHRCQNRIEVNGSRGSVIFDMERMNELEFYSTSDPAHQQGFRRVQVSEACHPYMANWWPPGHIIGFGDTFVNQAYDFITAIAEDRDASPDFLDGLRAQEVLEAAQRSAETKRWVNVKEVR